MSSNSNKHPLLPVPTVPCLVVDPDSITGEGRTILLDSSSGEYLTREIEALKSNMKFALTWQQGWILCLDPDDDGRTFLYQPHTLEKMELPHLKAQQRQVLPRNFECALTHDNPAANPGCVVVVLHPEDTCFWYCRVGGGHDAEWIEHEYDVGSQKYDPEGLVWKKIVIGHLTPCQGKLYFPAALVKHGILEFNPHPTIRIVPMSGLPGVVPPNPWGFVAHGCYFEMDGQPHQFFVFYYEDPTVATSITLYRIDVERQRWCEVDDIGDRALLWSGYCGGCCSASKFGMEPNCVYRIHKHDSSLHIFDITESTERVCRRFHPSKDDIPELSAQAFWLLPGTN